MIGTCRLCQKPRAELRESHIIPRWAYKRMRDTMNSANPNPVVVTFGTAAQVSSQVTEYILCEACEQKFGELEKYVASLAYTPSGDPVLLKCLGVTPSGAPSKSARYTSAKDLDTEKLVLFGSSVIWRACVAKRKDTGKPSLGRKYVKEFRRYLNGETSFPPNARLIFAVLDQPMGVAAPLHNIASFPVTLKKEGYHHHVFYLCGLYFDLAVGNVRPSYMNTMCLHHSKEKYVLFVTAEEIGLLCDILTSVKNAKAMGKLK